MPENAQPNGMLASAVEPIADQGGRARPGSPSIALLIAVAVLAAASWALVIWPVPMGSDSVEIVDDAPSSPAAVTLYVALSMAVVLTTVAVLGWWWRTRSTVILVVGWLMLGVVVFGAAFGVMFVLPFL